MKHRLSDFGFKVERQNARYALCTCPFHNDKHASAIIYLDSNWFNCFACHVSLPLQKAAEQAGFGTIDIDAGPQAFNVDLLLEDVHCRPLTNEALEYLGERGVKGDFPPYLVSPMSNAGVSFAFKDNRGRLLGLQTRLFPENVIDKASRYMFEGKKLPFFGDYKAHLQNKTKLIVFEKAFATLKADIANKRFGLGITPISSVGSHFNRELLQFTNIDTLFFFDKDDAGRSAGLKVKELTGARVVLPGTLLDELSIDEIGSYLGKYIN